MMGARVVAGFQVTVSASEGHVDLAGPTAEIEGKLEFRGREQFRLVSIRSEPECTYPVNRAG